MGIEEFDVEQISRYKLVEAKEALRVADHLMEKKDYSYALFFGHLAVEKILKALYASEMEQHAPPIHNLLRLAKNIGLALNEERTKALVTITTFNIEARYPDIKRNFRQKCTLEYTNSQMGVIKDVFEWLISLMV